jgi:RimJ/RimL family protein N-acetyltransferase
MRSNCNWPTFDRLDTAWLTRCTTIAKKKMASFVVDTVSSDEDLQQILDLQAKNLHQNLSQEEAESEGFVTIEHDFDLLKRMNSPHPHIVARDARTNQVIGYVLVMLPAFRTDIPFAGPMMDQIDQVVYQGQRLGGTYSSNKAMMVLVGQLCVDKTYRGLGISTAMYREYQRLMEPHFHHVVTLVSSRNPGSMRAHEKVGFQAVHRYGGNQDNDWVVLVLPTATAVA